MLSTQNFFFFLKKFKGTGMQFKKAIVLRSRQYENQNSKNFILHLRMNLLQFSGTNIYLFIVYKRRMYVIT